MKFGETRFWGGVAKDRKQGNRRKTQNFGPQSSLEGSDREEASPKVKWDGWSSFALRSCHDSSQGPARYIPQLEVRS